MRRAVPLLLACSLVFATASCNRRRSAHEPAPAATVDDPFAYPFVRQIHVPRKPDAPYAGYKALYLITEDFEPYEKTPEEIREITGILGEADALATTYHVPW